MCGLDDHGKNKGCLHCLPGIDCGLLPELPDVEWPEIEIDDGPPINMRDFTLGPREVLCSRCYLMHRADLACEEAW